MPAFLGSVARTLRYVKSASYVTSLIAVRHSSDPVGEINRLAAPESWKWRVLMNAYKPEAHLTIPRPLTHDLHQAGKDEVFARKRPTRALPVARCSCGASGGVGFREHGRADPHNIDGGRQPVRVAE